MPHLGTLSSHQLLTRLPCQPGPFNRTAGLKQFFLTRLPATKGPPPAYLGDFASYPVRLNGIAYNFYSGSSVAASWPRTRIAQPVIDSFGMIFYHPHEYRINWSVNLGPRNFRIHCKHTCTEAPYPYVEIQPNASAGIAYQKVSTTPAIDTDNEIIVTLNPTINTVIDVKLGCDNVKEHAKTTWGIINTT